MTTKEYLSQAWRIDRMVNAKLQQAQSLRNLSEKASATLSDTPPSDTPNPHRMEDIIIKMIDLEAEINADIDRLVDLKREIMRAIKALENDEYKILLELRYLCFMPWRDIAAEMQYGVDNVYKLHQKAISLLSLQLNGVELQ